MAALDLRMQRWQPGGSRYAPSADVLERVGSEALGHADLGTRSPSPLQFLLTHDPGSEAIGPPNRAADDVQRVALGNLVEQVGPTPRR